MYMACWVLFTRKELWSFTEMLPINGHSLRWGCQKKLNSSLLTSVIGKHNNCTQTTGLSSHNWLTIPNLTNFRLPKMFIFCPLSMCRRSFVSKQNWFFKSNTNTSKPERMRNDFLMATPQKNLSVNSGRPIFVSNLERFLLS